MTQRNEDVHDIHKAQLLTYHCLTGTNLGFSSISVNLLARDGINTVVNSLFASYRLCFFAFLYPNESPGQEGEVGIKASAWIKEAYKTPWLKGMAELAGKPQFSHDL